MHKIGLLAKVLKTFWTIFNKKFWFDWRSRRTGGQTFVLSSQIMKNEHLSARLANQAWVE